jgi:hypothetical protein
VVIAADKLQSHHASSRRDGAKELGQLGDPRAIPPLVHVLKYDSSKDVRIAAATSLGQLGGPESEVVLERCVIYEKKQDVRDAAAAALRMLRQHQAAIPLPSPNAVGSGSQSTWASAPYQAPQSEVPRIAAPPVPQTRLSPFRSQPGSGAPALDGPAPEAPAAPDGERVPPPPPTPVNPS